MTTFNIFHRCRGLHKVSDVIGAGNWGRIILGWGPLHNRYLLEYVFERVRLAEFPQKVSRIACVFAFDDENVAKTWVRGNQAEPEHVYQVRPVDPQASIDRLDMSWTDCFSKYKTFDAVEECARRYWAGTVTAAPKYELLVGGDVVVERRVNSIDDDALQTSEAALKSVTP